MAAGGKTKSRWYFDSRKKIHIFDINKRPSVFFFLLGNYVSQAGSFKNLLDRIILNSELIGGLVNLSIIDNYDIEVSKADSMQTPEEMYGI